MIKIEFGKVEGIVRTKRDLNKRGRTIESVIQQYIETEKPMHEKFIEKTKSFADILILNGGKNKMALNVINSELLPVIDRKIKNVKTK